VTKQDSPFLSWFIEQHGEREGYLGSGFRDVPDEELQQRIAAGKFAEAELRHRREWDMRQQSALYAWTARGRE